jgi:hypothetical protein
MAQRQPSLFLSLSNEVEAVGGSGTANREPPMASQFAILGGSISGGPLTIRRGGLWRSVLAGCISGASVSLSWTRFMALPSAGGRSLSLACCWASDPGKDRLPFCGAACMRTARQPGRIPAGCQTATAARCTLRAAKPPTVEWPQRRQRISPGARLNPAASRCLPCPRDPHFLLFE